MKLRSILEAKYHLGINQIELTQAPSDSQKKRRFQKMVSELWPDGVMYKGQPVFNLIYENHLKGLEAELEHNNRQNVDDYDQQESYLGYVPAKDMFVLGFDVWAENEEEDGELVRVKVPNTIFFQLGEQGATTSIKWKDLRLPGQLFYPSTYAHIHRSFPTLIDLRLD